MGLETGSTPVCPGVNKVWLAGNSGFVYRMSNDYMKTNSPFAFAALVDACAGNIGRLYRRSRADTLILGPGRYERELIQPAQVLANETQFYRQLHVHGVDLNPVPDDVAPQIDDLTRQNPRIQLTHREGIDLASLPVLAPLIKYLDREEDDMAELSRSWRRSSALHQASYLSFPIDTVSVQGVLDYLPPKEMTALLLYITYVIRPSTLLVRLAYGTTGRSYMDSADREVFETSIERAAESVHNRSYSYMRPIEFMNSILTLRSMSQEDREKARLKPDYPGSYPPVDALINFMQSSDAFCGCDSAVELWKLPTPDGNEEIASILATFKHW